MNVSVCITVLNEEDSVASLIESLSNQTKRPNEIIIVDGGSTDKTLEIIAHYQKRFKGIKLLKDNCSRAKGRNLGVEMARNNLIAMTDSGCVANKDWLKNLVKPFENRVDVAAGFYSMVYKNTFEKAESFFLGVIPKDFDIEFLPSTRSIAFTKEIWEQVGGFPENLEGAAEDTVFNLKLIQNNAKISRVKNSIVEWGMPGDLTQFFWKVYEYAKGDAKSKVWIFPGKHLMSHNIKALSVLLRYLIGIYFVYLSIFYNLTPLFLILIFVYLVWAYRKILIAFGDYKTALWGPILQITSDLGVMYGFLNGFFGKKK